MLPNLAGTCISPRQSIAPSKKPTTAPIAPNIVVVGGSGALGLIVSAAAGLSSVFTAGVMPGQFCTASATLLSDPAILIFCPCTHYGHCTSLLSL